MEKLFLIYCFPYIHMSIHITHHQADCHNEPNLGHLSVPPGFRDRRISCGIWTWARQRGIAWLKHGKADFPWHWANFLSTEVPFSEHGISISWVQNFHFLSAEFWAVSPVYECKNCIFWAKNFYFGVQKFSFFSDSRILGSVFSFWVQNLHFLSSEILFLSAEFRFLSAEFWFF